LLKQKVISHLGIPHFSVQFFVDAESVSFGNRLHATVPATLKIKTDGFFDELLFITVVGSSGSIIEDHF